LLNETRELLVISRADLDDDQSMSRLRLRIQTYLDVHQVYEPLRLAITEVEATLDELDQKSDSLLGIRDLSGKRRAALRAYREDFLEVHGFLDRLEQITKYLPYRTGLLAGTLESISQIIAADRESRISQSGKVEQLVDEGLRELANSELANFTEKLVRARHRLVTAFS
jgi:hypothetical protein